MTTTYTLSTHFNSGEVTHTLERDRLVVTYAKTARTESIPFASIKEINLRQEMVGVYTAHVKREGASTIMIPSRHFRGIGRFDERPAEYSAFMREVVEACTKAGTRVTAGSSVLWALGWVLVVMGALLTGGVIIGSIARGLPPLRMLFVLPLSFAMGFGFVRQGRARAVDPQQIPPEVMPA